MSNYVFKKLASLDLICAKCECGELNVIGFYQQLNWTVHEDKLLATAIHPCSKCKGFVTVQCEIALSDGCVQNGLGI